MERYYEDYINAVVLDSAATRFKQFSSIFQDKNYASRMELLKRNIEKVELPKNSTPSLIWMYTSLESFILAYSKD